MINARLEILNKSVPFGIEIPVAITYQASDVREPDKRNSSFSKTIEIEGTNEINKIFENIFDVNTVTQTFNKNRKTACKYFDDEIETFSGSLRLIKVNIKTDGKIIYECTVSGEGGSIFFDIGDRLITGNVDTADDLDFSAYDHTYDRATQVSTRSNAGTGLDVVYPFIDKGSNGGSDTIWNVEDFLPCFHAWEYLTKILTKAGYTFESTLLDSSEGKSLIVYPNITDVPLDSAQLNDSQFYVGETNGGTTTAIGILSASKYVYPLSDTTNAPFFDVGGQYSSPVVTLNNNGKYNIVSVQNLSMIWSHTNPVVHHVRVSGLELKVGIEVSYDSGVTWSFLADIITYWAGSAVVFSNVDPNFTVSVSTGELALQAGTMLRHSIEMSSAPPTYTWYDVVNNPIFTGTGTWDIGWNGTTGIAPDYGTQFYGLLTNKSIVDGQTMICNNALPVKLKQRDLFKSIIQLAGLNIQPLKTNPRHLIIEDYGNFYNDEIIDYRDRTDKKKDVSVNPNLLEAKRYIYRYKEDNDFWNKEYQTKYSEPYGTETVIVDNDFTKDDKVNEIIFSPTPNVANYDLGIAHPRIYALESGIKKPIVPNVRLLYCSGVKQAQNNIIYRDSVNLDLISKDYLYAGHVDDPFDPTVDLNFGTPKEVYYNFINASFTDNNAFNRFHSNPLNNITNRDSKFVTKYLWLTSLDINKFSFRHRWFIEDAYYIVNKIIDYEASKSESVQCELIKLLTLDTFTPTTFRLSDSTSINTGRNVSTAKLNSGLNVGNNIQNRGTNCIAIGDNIMIPESCSNVTVMGNNVVVSANVSNSSVVNTNNYELTRSNFNITNSVVVTDLFRIGEVETSNATTTKLAFDTTTGEFEVQQDQTMRIEVRVLATNQNGTRDSKEWVAQGVAEGQSPPTYSIVEAVTSTFSDASLAAATFAIVATGTPGDEFLEFQVTGIAATDIKWKCQVEIIKIQN